MTDSQENPEVANELPKARVHRRKWGLQIVWIVPVVAAIVAGYLVYDRVQEYGSKITIMFKDGSGIRAGETPIKYRGVTIGDVTAVRLSEDLEHVVVMARIHRSASSVAREGSVFWVVRPELGVGTLTGLRTVITGPEIEVLPGTGKTKMEFVGLESSPAAVEREGLRIVLVTSRLGSLRPGSPVYYRGIEVGIVQDCQLSRDAISVEIHVFIKLRYARLVRTGSRFWNVSGLDLNLGLFRGLEISVESLRSLVAGGITFATPDDPNDKPVKNGTAYILYDKPQKEWLQWSPQIPIPPEK
jgi:paraquat-inducible protein B